MALVALPVQWRKTVCNVLQTGRSGAQIKWTQDAWRRFEADGAAAKMSTGSAEPVWEYEVHEAFERFLSTGAPLGCPVCMHSPSGECFEFFFPFFGKRFYGKILLRAERREIVIFSAHRPLKERLSCE